MSKVVIRRACFMLVTALTVLLPCIRVSAQDVRVTLDKESAPLKEVLDAIEKQTRYLFSLTPDVDENQPVTVKGSNVPLRTVLDQLKQNKGLSYRVSELEILIFNEGSWSEQPKTVTGTVTDSNGQPIIGAGVLIEGTLIGAATDENGRFSLDIPARYLAGQLVFESLGYETVAFGIGNRMVFNVTLEDEAQELEGTVVTALGIRRDQKALSYNVQEISSDLVTTVKDANFVNSLTGKVAGVTINSSSSGVGGASKVVLRGNKSIMQSSNVLYVVDGVPMYNFGGGGGTEFDSKGETEAIADLNPAVHFGEGRSVKTGENF